MTTPALAVETEHGRHYRDLRDGTLLPSVTNVIGILHKESLESWKRRQVAEAALLNIPHLTKLANTVTLREATNRLAAVPDTIGNRAGERGDYVHGIAEAKLRGTELPPPPDDGAHSGYVLAFDRWNTAYKPRAVEFECTVFNWTMGYAGTADLFAFLGNDPRLFGVDYKSSKQLRSTVAMQVAALAHGEAIVYLDDDENFCIREMPVIQAGAGVLLRANGTQVCRELDLGWGWTMFCAALELFHGEHGTSPILGVLPGF